MNSAFEQFLQNGGGDLQLEEAPEKLFEKSSDENPVEVSDFERVQRLKNKDSRNTTGNVRIFKFNYADYLLKKQRKLAAVQRAPDSDKKQQGIDAIKRDIQHAMDAQKQGMTEGYTVTWVNEPNVYAVTPLGLKGIGIDMKTMNLALKDSPGNGTRVGATFKDLGLEDPVILVKKVDGGLFQTELARREIYGPAAVAKEEATGAQNIAPYIEAKPNE